FHADAKLASERRIAQRVLILLIPQIRDAAVDADSVVHGKRCGRVHSSVPGILGESEAKKIAVRAAADKIPPRERDRSVLKKVPAPKLLNSDNGHPGGGANNGPKLTILRKRLSK